MVPLSIFVFKDGVVQTEEEMWKTLDVRGPDVAKELPCEKFHHLLLAFLPDREDCTKEVICGSSGMATLYLIACLVVMAFTFFNLYTGTDQQTTIYSSDPETYKRMVTLLKMRQEKSTGTPTDTCSEPAPKKKRVSADLMGHTYEFIGTPFEDSPNLGKDRSGHSSLQPLVVDRADCLG